MALVAAGARALLGALLTWRSARHVLAAQACAVELGHLYEAIAERKVLFMSAPETLLAHFSEAVRCMGMQTMHAAHAAAQPARCQQILPDDSHASHLVKAAGCLPQCQVKHCCGCCTVNTSIAFANAVQDLLGMYCHVLLADYIALAAAPGNLPAAAAGGGAPEGLPKVDGGDAAPGIPGLLPAAAAALRPGACALYGACSPAQVREQLKRNTAFAMLDVPAS